MLVEARIKRAQAGDKIILKDAMMYLEEGERILVVGPSGGGKTSLLLTVTGIASSLLSWSVEGESMINGVNALADFSRIPGMVGVVLQDPDRQLAMPTPLDEVLFTLENLGYPRDEACKKALKALEDFGLRGLEDKLVEDLSGGQKRRLTLAASIVHDPLVMFLDEPTASVDPWGIREVRRFAGSRYGLVIIEHKARYFLDIVDRILLVTGGTTRINIPVEEVDDNTLEMLESIGVDASSPEPSRLSENVGGTVLEANNVTVSYPDGTTPIRDASLEVRSGELVVLVGPNGSGKTSLLRALSGALKYEGEVKARDGVFLVPQNPDYMFLHPSVKAELDDVRARTGIDPVEAMGGEPPWLGRVLRLNPARLSHGQRRWLAVAIAMAYRPGVLLMDEPTTGLDKSLLDHLVDAVKRVLSSGRGVLASTHDPRLVASADRAYMVDGGRVREVDPDDALRVLDEAWR
ncbi:MAG: ATP-binding cassette domain-containing protein [Desulfurococcales archaeon]|nr:ATP-binding cassette domain-containing protein [Desulfurococcales archaeon]